MFFHLNVATCIKRRITCFWFHTGKVEVCNMNSILDEKLETDLAQMVISSLVVYEKKKMLIRGNTQIELESFKPLG